MGETDRIEDAYRFRTPMLRNVALTAPYGHNGAFPTLEAMIKHHLDPGSSFQAWQPAMAQLPDVPWLAATDFIIWQDDREMQRQSRVRDVQTKQMGDDDIADLVAFMHALTGTDSIAKPKFGVPKSFRP